MYRAIVATLLLTTATGVWSHELTPPKRKMAQFHDKIVTTYYAANRFGTNETFKVEVYDKLKDSTGPETQSTNVKITPPTFSLPPNGRRKIYLHVSGELDKQDRRDYYVCTTRIPEDGADSVSIVTRICSVLTVIGV